MKHPCLNYIVNKEIGDGTYGKVYKVYDITNNKYYAMKKMLRINNNIQENEIINLINHPNIINYYKTINDGLNIYQIMELGKEDIYQKYNMLKTYISLDEIIVIIKSLSNAIQYLHHKNIVHGDIKIENIIICDNTYKLCDFSLSFFCSFIKNCPYTYRDIPIPEIRYGLWGKTSDIWCFGKTINTLLQIYFCPQKYSLDTVDEKYYKLIELRDLCKEENYLKRINIDEIQNKLKSF